MNTIAEAVERLWNLRESIKELREAERQLEFDLITDMEANDQTAHEDARYSARIPVKREYDVAKFAATFGELLEPELFDSMYSPAHEVTKTVAATVNGVQAKKLTDLGYGEQVEGVLLPNARKLVIKAKKKTETPL